MVLCAEYYDVTTADVMIQTIKDVTLDPISINTFNIIRVDWKNVILNSPVMSFQWQELLQPIILVLQPLILLTASKPYQLFNYELIMCPLM